MIKLSTLFWLIAVTTAGFAMFAVKYEVQGIADQLTHTIKQADDTERDIRVLDAEWAYLNRPDALAQMNQRFLSLVPIATKQLRTSVADIPMRPTPPLVQPSVPVETVAADAPIAVAQASAQSPAPEPAAPAANPVQPRPAESSRPVVTVALNTHVGSNPSKPAVVKAAARLGPSRHAASLNELIAQIVESR